MERLVSVVVGAQLTATVEPVATAAGWLPVPTVSEYA